MNFISVISTYHANRIKKKQLISFYKVLFIFKYANISIKREKYYYKRALRSSIIEF